MKEEVRDTGVQRGTAVIIGGSLAGLMTGIALAREDMFVTILEKSSAARPTGGGLQVDNGRRDRSRTARLLRKLVTSGKSPVKLWSTIEFRLRKEAEAYVNIDLRYLKRVASLDQNTDAAWAVTDQGEIFIGDILIGADGHRSLVRQHVAPHHPHAWFAGYTVWIASVHEADLPRALRLDGRDPGSTMLSSDNGFLFGTILEQGDGSSVSGNRQIGCAWYDNTRNELLRRFGCVQGDVVRHSLKGAAMPEEAISGLADQASLKWPEPWLSITLQALKTRQLTGIPVKEYIPDQLAQARMALVGDAAHVPAPITASGVNESLQDAAALGESVAKEMNKNGIISALDTYDSLRLPKVRQIVQSGHAFSQTFGRP